MRVRLLVLLGVATWLMAMPLRAALTDYYVSYSTGTETDMSGASTLWGVTGRGNYTYGRTTMMNIGFNFVFNGVTYSTLSVSSSGCVGLGSTYVTSTLSNSFYSVNVPMLMPYWDGLRIDPGGNNSMPSSVTYKLTGTAPSQVLTIQWKSMNTQGGGVGNYCFRNSLTFQLRLYEGTNKIEFYYGEMNPCSASNYDCYGSSSCMNTSGSIGIAASTSDWISVLPQTSGMSVVRYSSYYNVDLYYNKPSSGAVYTFQPCTIGVTGNISQGGTSTMAPGDTLMKTVTVQRGSTQGYTPLNVVNNIAGCSGRIWSASISGPNASDYSIVPNSGSLANGSSVTPTINFTPGALGVRRATLTIVDNNYYSRTFNLAASGSPRIQWIPDLAQGGTTNMANGDTLMRSVIVNRRTTQDLTPFRLYNYNTNPAATPAQITVQLDSFGFPSTQYQIAGPTTASLTAGQSFTPVIRFTGIGVGPQEARLIVNADGEIRTFVLAVISGAPAIVVTAGGAAVNPNSPVFVNTTGCVGEHITSLPFAVRNTGTLPLVISAIDVYGTDSTMGQGTPPFPLLRDAFGNLIRAFDYVISETPAVVPLAATPSLPLPYTIAPGTTANLYLTFVGQRPGKRYARVFMTSNGENIYGVDPDDQLVLGLLTFDALGRSTGSRLAARTDGQALKTVVFPPTAFRDTSFAWFTISNAGPCELRISRDKLMIADGDVTEFTLMQVLRNSAVDASNHYVIAPGSSDSIRVRFVPSRSGTRQARIRLQTNDSTLGLAGLTETGSHYVDLHGRALAGLDGKELVLAPVVIGTSVTGTTSFENSSNDMLQVDRIIFTGGQAAEFTVDAPTNLPLTVAPGAKLDVTVRLTPVGAPGDRRSYVTLVTNTGDTIVSLVRGEAGTQELSVSPTSLFDNIAIGVGETARRSVLISNNGTMPLRLTSVAITGADAANYRMGIMPRFDIGAGATEYLEITFAPSTQGQSSAQLDVVYAGTTTSVALGGTALRARGGDPTTGTIGGATGTEYRSPEGLDAPAGTGSVEAHGFVMMASRPNPTATTTTIEYTLASAADVRIELFNARGDLVRTLADVAREPGRYSVTADLSALPEGTYRAVMTAGTVRLVQSVVVVR